MRIGIFSDVHANIEALEAVTLLHAHLGVVSHRRLQRSRLGGHNLDQHRAILWSQLARSEQW